MAEAMKLVIGGFLSAVVDGAAAKSVACLESNYEMPERAKELMGELKTRLTMVKAASEAADNRLITNANLVQWLSCLHAAAQEAEDAIDEIEFDEASITGKRKVSELIVSSLMSLKSLVFPGNSLGRLEHAVKTLTQLCASSATFVELLKMDNSNENQQQAEIVRETSSQLPVDVHVFGRDEVTEFILTVIIGSSSHDQAGSSSDATKIRTTKPNILVLPIVGMSGVGKTTLAQVIYNHAKVKEHFQHRAWVYVSEHFSLKRILQEILCSFNGYKDTGIDTGDSLEAITTKLRSKICGRYRFFLVLDNIWVEMRQEWSTLLTVLSDEAHQRGSVLLLTTQSQRVAQIKATISPINLKALPWESFWPLFQYHAFGGQEVVQQEHSHSMLLIGEEIAKKLDGLPLAAKVMGNLLRCRFSRDYWRRVAQSDWWNLGDALQDILPYLRVSYQHLSPKQRRCFAYCSIFPRNYLFDKDRVVQMWIAHDFIQSNDVADAMRLEDVGRQCFDELVDRSLFQPTLISKKYVMHESARGLAIAVSLHQCFLPNQISGGASSQALENVRHLALQASSLEQCQELYKYRNLRTLLIFGRFETTDAFFPLLDGVLRNSPSLRVLDLSYVEAQGNGWPNDAKGLRKLRFLDLSFTRITALKGLPSNLQVLHLRGYGANSLPQSITSLANLRHLYVDDSALSKIQWIGQLTELQELDSFNVGKGRGFTLRELKNMRELTGRLCIRGIENVRSKEAVEARLMDKKHLGTLVIEGRKVPKFALEGLQPHPNIQELTIKFYQDQVFPHWVLQPDNLSNLLHVNLESCRHLSTLPPLGHLPLLKHLSLGKLPSIKHVDGDSFGDFPSLEGLEFHWMEKWVEWTEPKAAAARPYGPLLFLGRLKKLHIEYCPLLRQFPRFPYLSALKELQISEPGSYILELPACLQVLACLTAFKMEYCNQSVVLSAHQLKSLENLELIRCEGLRLADGFQYFSNLRTARVEGCPRLLSGTASVCVGLEQESHDKQQKGANLLTHLRTDNSLMTGDYFRTVGNLPSLRHLTLFDIPNTPCFSRKQELWFEQLISLDFLQFFSKDLQCLPSSLAALTSIKKLELHSLESLSSLPDGALPPNLEELYITNCPRDLNVRVSKDGADWGNVAHVPYINIEGTVIQNI